MFPARSYHRTTVLLGSDSCAAGLFRAAGQDGGVPPAVLYRTATTADEAANILPKVGVSQRARLCCAEAQRDAKAEAVLT